METTGILKAAFATERVNDKFQKREFVLTTEPNTPYPQHVSFQLIQDKCGVLDSYKTGEEIKVYFNIKGREWNGPQGVKYFNTLEAWRIERVNASTSGSAPSNPAPTKSTSAPAPVATPAAAPEFVSTPIDNDEDLPF
jgi:hypothetical protein